MRPRLGLAFAVLAALASLYGSASANRLSVSSSTMRLTFSAIKFVGAGGITSIVCPLTLEGSFHHSTIPKSLTLIGQITSAATTGTSCRGGSVIVLNGVERLPEGSTVPSALPWHVFYDAFTGTLPTITGVRLGFVRMGFLQQVNILGEPFSCLYISSAIRPAFAIANVESGVVRSLRMDVTAMIPAALGQPAWCPAGGNFEGIAFFSGEGRPVTLTLI